MNFIVWATRSLIKSFPSVWNKLRLEGLVFVFWNLGITCYLKIWRNPWVPPGLVLFLGSDS